MPAISVIMPVYNAAASLRAALDSVLAQTYDDFSLVVIDDGSTDNSREIVDSYRDSRIIHLINNKNRGIEFSLNRGIAASLQQITSELVAKSDCQYVFRMDSDDICLPQRFAMQVEFMQANPSTWVLGSWAEMLYANNTSSLGCTPLGNDSIRARMLFHAPLIHPSCAVRREVFEKIKYNNKYPAAEDYDLWCKLALNPQCRFDCLPKALLKYRLSEQSISASRRDLQRESTRQVRKNFLQRLGFDLDLTSGLAPVFASGLGSGLGSGLANSNSSQALKIHNIWAEQEYHFPFSQEFIAQIEGWAFYLLAQNKQNKYCSSQALQLELARRYLAIGQSIGATQPELALKIKTSPLIPADIEHAPYF